MASNMKIRLAAMKSGLKLWQVAELIGMRDDSFSRKLRYELPHEEQERICKLIDDYAKGKRGD